MWVEVNGYNHTKLEKCCYNSERVKANVKFFNTASRPDRWTKTVTYIDSRTVIFHVSQKS